MGYRFLAASNQRITWPAITGFTGNNAFTFCARVYVEDATNTGYILHGNNSNTGTHAFCQLIRLNTSGVIDVTRRHADGSNTGFRSNETVATGRWYSLVMTWPAGAYGDYTQVGVNVSESGAAGVAWTANAGGSGNGTGAAVAMDGVIDVGDRTTGSRAFTGIIEDARIYSKVLSASEIAAYHAGTLTAPGAADLCFYAPLLANADALEGDYGNAGEQTNQSGTATNTPVRAVIDHLPVTRMLSHYYRASSGCFTDTGGTAAVAASGDRVANWKDQTLCQNTATQGTAGSRPQWYSRSDGNKFVEFDGDTTTRTLT